MSLILSYVNKIDLIFIEIVDLFLFHSVFLQFKDTAECFGTQCAGGNDWK